MDRGVRQHQLKGGVINTREVAGARWLVLFRAEGEGVDVDTLVGVSGVVLVRLDEGEVRTFTFRETVLAVKLELSGDDGVLTPAVEVEGGFGEHKGAGIGDTRVAGGLEGLGVPVGCRRGDIHCGGVPEETRGRDEVSSIGLTTTTEGHDGVRESINAVGVVEGLGTERAEEGGSTGQRRTVVNIGIRLNNEDQLFTGVVEVELNLVTGATDGLIAGKLKLFDEVFVGVLGHTTTFIRVQEDVVDIERGSDEGLIVGGGNTLAGGSGASDVTNGPQALINRTNIQVNLDFVVLKGDEGKSKPRVAAVPELEGNIEGGFRESITGLAHLGGGVGRTGSIDGRERGVSDEGQLGGVTNHLEVTTLLFLGQGELIPQVHPVTILTVNALTSDFDFNLGNHLLPREIEPTGPNTGVSRVLHALVDFGQCHL